MGRVPRKPWAGRTGEPAAARRASCSCASRWWSSGRIDPSRSIAPAAAVILLAGRTGRARPQPRASWREDRTEGRSPSCGADVHRPAAAHSISAGGAGGPGSPASRAGNSACSNERRHREGEAAVLRPVIVTWPAATTRMRPDAGAELKSEGCVAVEVLLVLDAMTGQTCEHRSGVRQARAGDGFV